MKCIENGDSKRSIGKKFGINESTVRGIFQKRDQIRAHMRLASSAGASSAKRSGNRVLLKTEQLMWRYINKQARRNKLVDTRDLVDTALDLYARVAVKLGIDNPPVFVASKGWVNKFQKRQKVKSVKASGEAASADRPAAIAYPEVLKGMIEAGQYTPDQIFNMDETNFYWKIMPKKTFITEDTDKVRGRKPIRERFTLLFVFNASGTCKTKPTVIHKVKKPRAYKGFNMQRLNVSWLTSKKGYMSAKLSMDWFNDHFVPQVEKYCEESNVRFNILLILDNAPGHSPLIRTANPNVRVEFLPPNTTSLIQPLDQEVISVVKATYSKCQFRQLRQATRDDTLLQQLVDSEDEGVIERGNNEAEKRVTQYWKKYTIKQAVDLLVDCWNNKVTPATIHHG